MSFRTRLTSFFVVIVILPMLAVGALVYRLISDSEAGKADARASGLAAVAQSVYVRESAAAQGDAQTIGRHLALLKGAALHARLNALLAQTGLARIEVVQGGRVLADAGDPTAVAPGVADVSVTTGGRPMTVTASELTAAAFAHDVSGAGDGVVIRQGAKILAATAAGLGATPLPEKGDVTFHGVDYRTITLHLQGFGGSELDVAILSGVSATATSSTSTRALATVFIVGFLILAFLFSLLASRALQGQVRRFLQAARRLAGGDFSQPIQTEGRDEFAALGQEFNNMSTQLERRLEELSQERARLRASIRRIGQTFASNLDRPALLELALKTSVDAVEANCGRVSVRPSPADQLGEAAREGSLAGFEQAIYDAERSALSNGGLAHISNDGVSVVSFPLGPQEADGRAHGVISVARRGTPFTDDEREVLQSLGSQAGLALENVELHQQVSRQAVTDELTGLTNHGRFQELLGTEIEEVRRYHHPVGLIMLDIDNFKSINDTYGHQQGDIVLKQVARVLQQNSRDVDTPARYGGEEMALILPHTDLEGAYAIAERVRTAVEGLRIPRTDRQGTLRVTTSVGVAAATDGDKDELIADADAALYDAKRQGKNRTIRAATRAANVSGAE